MIASDATNPENLDAKLLPSFERRWVTINNNQILALIGGSGPPLLMLHGGGDQLIDPEAAKAFSERISSEVTFKSFPEQAHEIHYDRMAAEVFNTVLDWVKKQ